MKNFKNDIKGDYGSVKVDTKGLFILRGQTDRIIDGIELILDNSRHAANKDEIGLREEIHQFFDMLYKNGEISNKIVNNIDYTIRFYPDQVSLDIPLF